MKAHPALLVSVLASITLAAACGEDDRDEGTRDGAAAEQQTQIREASKVTRGDFPTAGGRTLQQIAGTVNAGPQVSLATSVFTPGENRLAFGLLDQRNQLVYGKTAVYVARGPDAQAQGPYPAPTDSLVVEPPFRSRTAEAEEDVPAIYATRAPFPRPGRYTILTLTRTAQPGLYGGQAEVRVTAGSPIPETGERPPAVATDTLASAGGNIEAIDTRVPPDDMHETSFKEVLGKRPVALLFATPQLCQTRVCGPVTDIAAQLQSEYGDRMEFIHQEVYVDNKVEKGLRPPLRAFGLRTEPWLFTVDAEGRVAERLEGSFGIAEFRRAVEAALR